MRCLSAPTAGDPNVCRTTAASLLTDQRRKVRSVPAVANRDPDLATAIALTAPACPVNARGRRGYAKTGQSPHSPGGSSPVEHLTVSLAELLGQFRGREPLGIAVLEAAILIETGTYKRLDKLILVTCAEEQQVERALRREGAMESDVRARLSRQLALEEKRKYADFVVDTSGTKEDTLRQTRAVYQALRSIET